MPASSATTSHVRMCGVNRHGRDFVVGDVHGCFRTLERALAKLSFDAAHDRLFGVGDLVERGPHSLQASNWLERHFAAVTLGNHDRAALSWLEARLRGSAPPAEGWIQVLDPREHQCWHEALLRMPLALTIETPYGRVGVVHAEAPHPDWDRATVLLEAGEACHIDDALLGFEEYTPAILEMKKQPVAGVRALVSGHFVVEDVTVRANRWNLDTGAGFADRNRLSLLEVNARELASFTFGVLEDM